jgi:hypothetical protein
LRNALVFVAALIYPRRLGSLIVAGVLPVAVWWYVAYRDNAGSDNPYGAETVATTGFFAFAYWCVWIAAVALGGEIRRIFKPRSPARSERSEP